MTVLQIELLVRRAFERVWPGVPHRYDRDGMEFIVREGFSAGDRVFSLTVLGTEDYRASVIVNGEVRKSRDAGNARDAIESAIKAFDEYRDGRMNKPAPCSAFPASLLQSADRIEATFSDGSIVVLKSRSGPDGIKIEPSRHAFDAFDTEVRRTMDFGSEPGGDIIHYALGLAGECGEVCEPIKKYAFNRRELDRQKVLGEIGDVLWYASALAQSLGFSLAEAAKMNTMKLRARYPDGYVDGGGKREE